MVGSMVVSSDISGHGPGGSAVRSSSQGFEPETITFLGIAGDQFIIDVRAYRVL